MNTTLTSEGTSPEAASVGQPVDVSVVIPCLMKLNA